MKANTSEPGWFSTSATTSSAAAWPMVQRPVRTASIKIRGARRVFEFHVEPAVGEDAVLHRGMDGQIVGGAELDEPDGGSGIP